MLKRWRPVCLALLFLLCLLQLTGCGSSFQEVEGFEALQSGQAIHITFGQTHTLSHPLLDEGGEVELLAVPDGFSVTSLQTGQLAVTAQTLEGGVVLLQLSAPGYQTAELALIFVVDPLPQQLSCLPLSELAVTGSSGSYQLPAGEQAEWQIRSNAGTFDWEAELSDPQGGRLEQEGDLMRFFAGDQPLESPVILKVTAWAEGYQEESVLFEIQLTDPLPEIPFAASVSSLTVEAGMSSTFTLSLPQEAELSAVLSGDAAVLTRQGNVLTVTGQTPGTAVLQLSASAPGYRSSSLSIPVIVTLPKLPFFLGTDSLSVEAGGSVSLQISGLPDTVQLTAQITGSGLTAQVQGSGVTVQASESAASGSLLLTLSADGYQSVQATIPIIVTQPPTIPEVPAVDTSTYAKDAQQIIRLTNEYRAQNGLEPLEYVAAVDAPATIRASEAAESWSHTRPDGSEFQTVFADFGLRYAAYGENLFAVNAKISMDQVLQEWMESPSHRENILREEFTGIGVGIAYVDREYYYCQLFLTESAS